MRASRREVRRRTPRQEGRGFAAIAAALLIAGPMSFSTAIAAEPAPARDTTHAAPAESTAKPAEVSSTVAKPAEVSSTVGKPAEVSSTTPKPAEVSSTAAPAKKASAPARKTSGASAAKAAAPARKAAPSATKSAGTPAASAAPAQTQTKAAPAKSGTAASPTANHAAARPANAGGAAGAATQARSAASVTPVRAQPASSPVVVRQVTAPPPSPVEDRVNYQYNALGRRDPFQPLVGGGFVPAEVAGAPPDVGGLKVVGIIWGAEDKFALIEDPRGNSMVLRKGDKVMNGVVETLRRDAVVVKLTVDGSTDLLEIPLTRKGESNENR